MLLHNKSPITFTTGSSIISIITNITNIIWKAINIWDSLRDLVLFVQFKKRKERLRKSVTFSRVAGSKSNTHSSMGVV